MSAAKLFQEKLTILNTEFVDFVNGAVKENPSYDLTPSLTDYIDHVKELDKAYAGQKIAERKVITAVRRTVKEKPKSETVSVLKPLTEPPKDIGNGFVEPPGQFSGLPKVSMPKLPGITAPTFSAPKPVASSTPSVSSMGMNRKRRQQTALDYDEMKSSNSKDYGITKPSEPRELPPNLAAFSAQLKNDKEFVKQQTSPNSEIIPGKFPPFDEDKKANTESIKMIKFDGLKDISPENLTLTVPKVFAFEGRPAESPKNDAPKPGGLFTFGAKPSETLKPAVAPPSLFGASSIGDAKTAAFAPLNFGVKKADTEDKPAGPPKFSFNPLPSLGGASLNPLLGGIHLPKTSANLFASLPPSKQVNSGGDAPAAEGEGEEEDAPPPKPEVVEHKEKDAIYDTKCSVFTFADGEYKKTGIGHLFIKPSEKGSNLLIRAATTIGSVWVNTYIDDNFKANKKSKDKIQIAFPTPKGISTYLIRVVDLDTLEPYLTGAKKP